MTLSMWVYPNSTSEMRLIGNTIMPLPSFTTGFALRFQNLNLDVAGVSWHRGSDTQIIPNNWYHIVIVINDDDTSTAFINGNQERTVSTPNIIMSNLGIGARFDLSFGNFFDGLIDEVMIFNRALSSDEIASLYNSQANQFENNYEDLDSGSYTIQGYAVDSSGNQFNTEQRTIIVS